MTKRKPSYAAPLMSILMMQCSETKLSEMSINRQIFNREVKKAEAVYANYLQRYGLRYVELYPCFGREPRRGYFEQRDSNAAVC